MSLNSAFSWMLSPLVAGATLLAVSSGNVANANAVATLPGVASKTTYLSSFLVTSGGATVGLIVNGTITGLLGGTMTFNYAAVAGVLLGGQALPVAFPIAIPASAPNTSIVLTLPALGLGNTNAAVFAVGYQL